MLANKWFGEIFKKINIQINDTEYKVFAIADYGSGKRRHQQWIRAVTEIEKLLWRMVGGRGIDNFENQCNFSLSAEVNATW